MNCILTRLPAWALLLLLLACTRQESALDYYLAYADYRPVFMTRTALESGVAALPAQAMHNTGKIYVRGDYVFVNEKYAGIHIIDNRNPANPQPVSFLRIPGNVDMAVKGNILYADSGPDLVSIDISNPANAQLLGRVPSAFRELPMPVAGVLEDACQPANRPAGLLIVGWRKLAPGEAVPVKMPNRSSGGIFLNSASASYSTASSAGSVGKAGSLARFAILDQTLYTVDESSMHLFDLQNPTQPVAGKVVQLGFGLETIFPKDHYLFLGSQTGMYIYDVTQAASPRYVGGSGHWRSCDPVVVDGRFAYVTLRTSPVPGVQSTASVMVCGPQPVNELDVVDLANMSQPTLVRAYPMSSPQGLGAENSRLYVCDGGGLRIYDTSQAPVLTQVQQISTSITDVIPNGDYLLGVGSGGLYQYRVSGGTVQQVSVLPISPDA